MHRLTNRQEFPPATPRWPPVQCAEVSRVATRHWKTRAARGHSWHPGGISTNAITVRILDTSR